MPDNLKLSHENMMNKPILKKDNKEIMNTRKWFFFINSINNAKQ